MGHKGIRCKKDCQDPTRVKNEVRDRNWRLIPASGDHTKIVDPNTGEHVTMVEREMSIGVASQIFKFFLSHKAFLISVITIIAGGIYFAPMVLA